MIIEKTCVVCGVKFKTHSCYEKRRNGAKYCSAKCYQVNRRKNRVIEYDTDIFYLVSGGYYRSAKTSRLYHRVIWAENYGPIPNGCIVHHKDENTENNDVDNLIMVSTSQHAKIHYHYALDYNRNKPLNPCMIHECGKKVKGYGLCNLHYQRLKAIEVKGYSRDEAMILLKTFKPYKRIERRPYIHRSCPAVS